MFHICFFWQLTSRILSSESFKAIKTVRRIFRKFDEYGVVDVFKKYPSRSVIASVMALARLQSVASYYENKIGMLGDDVSDDEELLDRLAHYALFANAAYGWTMDLALRGKLHMGDLQALLKKTGIGPDDVVAAHWTAKTHRPVRLVSCIHSIILTTDVDIAIGVCSLLFVVRYCHPAHTLAFTRIAVFHFLSLSLVHRPSSSFETTSTKRLS